MRMFNIQCYDSYTLNILLSDLTLFVGVFIFFKTDDKVEKLFLLAKSMSDVNLKFESFKLLIIKKY